MARRIGNLQTPTVSGHSDIINLKQHENYVSSNIYPTPDNDALGSVRFDGTSSYLSRTPSTAGNRRTWTWSGWVKRAKITSGGGGQQLFYAGNSSSTARGGITLGDSGEDEIGITGMLYNGTTLVLNVKSTDQFRDTSSWLHFVVSLDTTQAVETDRVKIYVNNRRITSFSGTPVYPTQNSELQFNDSILHATRHPAPDYYLNLYHSQVNFVDGLALDPTYFAYTDRETGQWRPKRYTGNFGTNGFYLPLDSDDFSFNIDTSGNYTLTNSGADPVNDSTIGEYVAYFNGTSDYMSTPIPTTGTGTYSFSFWMNGGSDITSEQKIICGGTTGSPWGITLNVGRLFGGAQGLGSHIVSESIISANTWYHVVMTYDYGNTSFKIYINGEEVTNTGTYTSAFTNGTTIRFGEENRGLNRLYYGGYLSDVRIFNRVLSSTEVFSIYNKQKITLGLLAHFPLNKPFESTGLSVYDRVPDSPQNTFATLNPLYKSSNILLLKGNLEIDVTTTNYNAVLSTLAVSSGKWYFEGLLTGAPAAPDFGFALTTTTTAELTVFTATIRPGLYGISTDGTSTGIRYYSNTGTTAPTVFSTGWSTGDIISVYADFDSGVMEFARNGSWYGLAVSIPTGTLMTPRTSGYAGYESAVNFGQDHTFAGTKSALTTPYTDANGIGEFYYPPPDGALALCTQNLESGLKTTTVEKKYYNRDETGKTLSYVGYNDYTYGTINDERFSDLSPYASSYGGKSFAFDGSGVSIRNYDSNNTLLQFGSDPFTIECWVYLKSYESMFIEGVNNTGPQFFMNSLGALNFGISGTSPTVSYNISSQPFLNSWNHISVVREGTGTDQTKLYLNGVEVDTGTLGAVSPVNGFHISRSTGGYYIDGYIADLRLVKGIAVYTGNFTPPTAPLTTTQSSGTNIAAITGSETKLLLQPYNTETVNNTSPIYPRDEVGKILDYNGGVNFVNESPYDDNSVKSFDFNGTNGNIWIDDSADFHLSNNDFTIECWAYFNSTGTRLSISAQSDSGGTDVTVGHYIQKYSDDKIRFHAFTGSGTSATIYTSGTTTVSANQWYHLAVVRYNDTLSIYINGVSVNSYNVTETSYFNSTNKFSIGSIGENVSNFLMNGYISDYRFVNGTAVYTGNFTPPSGKLTTTGGTYPSTTNVNTSITAGHTVFLAQPYSQPATIPDSGSQYRTNRIYQTDETGKALIYG